MPQGTTYPSILGTIGNTPTVELKRIVPKEHARILLKLEFFNPLSSAKDRTHCCCPARSPRVCRVSHMIR